MASYTAKEKLPHNTILEYIFDFRAYRISCKLCRTVCNKDQYILQEWFEDDKIDVLMNWNWICRCQRSFRLTGYKTGIIIIEHGIEKEEGISMGMRAGEAKIQYIPELDVYKCEFGYIPKWKLFKEVLYKIIPSSDRSVEFGKDADGRDQYIWYIQAKSKDGNDYFGPVVMLMESQFHNVYKITKEQATSYGRGVASQPTIDPNHYVNVFNGIVSGLGLDSITETMGVGEVQKIYRKAALKLHPDRNPGDVAAATNMSKLNEAWTVLKSTKFKQEVSV